MKNDLKIIKSRTSRPSTYVLLSHASDSKTLPLSATEPTHCFDAFSIVIDPETGDALVERNKGTNARSDSEIKLNGHLLLDVTHIKPSAEFVIGSERYTYLKPLDVLLTEPKNDQLGRIEALAKTLDSYVCLNELLSHENNNSPKIVKLSRTSETSELHEAQLSKRGLQRFGLARPKIYAIAGLVVVLAGVGIGLKLSTKPSADSASTASKIMDVVKPKVVTSMDTKQSKESSIAGKTTTPSAVEEGKAIPLPTAHTPSTSTASSPELPSTKTLTKKPEAKPTLSQPKTATAIELNSAMRTKISEYILEARFDPNGATRKLEELKSKFPASSSAANEIQKKIDTIR